MSGFDQVDLFGGLHAAQARRGPQTPDELVDGLTGPQRDAVEHRGGPLLIVAGAGSGKTRVLTRRIAHLLATGDAEPQDILAITFTNKAANEMVERLVALVGERARRMWVMTFHKAFFRILQYEAEALGYKQRLTLYDDTDSRRLIQELLRERDVDPKKLTPKAVASKISLAKANLQTPAEFLEGTGFYQGPFHQITGEVFEQYERRLFAASAVDFDDLLNKPVELFRRNEEIRQAYAQRFRHVLVDEFQDTNRAQNELVFQLTREHRQVCVVGDSDQSIYRFRAADIRNILDFESTFPDATVVVLEQNFRSTQRILDAANAVISNNASRVVKNLFTEEGDGVPITVYGAMDERDEAAWVAAEVVRLNHHEGIDLSEIAIFYRTNAQSRVLEEEFNRAGIAHRLVGATRFYDRREIRDLLAYVRLIRNRDDEVSARRIINVPKRGIGQTSVTKLGSFAARSGISFGEALERAAEAGLTAKAASATTGLAGLLETLRTEAQTLTPSALLAEVFHRSGIEAELIAEQSIEAESRLENLHELINSVAQMEADGVIETIDEFLESAALVSAQDDLNDDAPKVSLMTLHVAKGLEYQAAFITGLEEGIFPHFSSRDDEEQLEEERRLAYVGITRARRILALTHAERRFRFGGEQGSGFSTSLPSRFLAEIPENLTVRLGSAGMPRPSRWNDDPVFERPSDDDGRVFGRPSAFKRPPAPTSGAERLNLTAGETVIHERWGAGVVVSTSGSREMAAAKVRFADVGEKNLLLSVAPLRRP